jgi:hypothetical protein
LLLPSSLLLLLARHPYCHCHCPCCLSLVTLVAIAITLFVAFAFNYPSPLLPSRHRSGGGGEDHPDLLHNQHVAAAAGIAIIVAAIPFAHFAAHMTSQEGPV